MPVRRRIIPFLALALSLLALAPLAAQEKTLVAAPALFRLETKKTVMYFFGSVHVGSADMYPLPPAVMSAFIASEKLVVEVKVDEVAPEEVMDSFRKNLSYQPPDSLEKHLSAEDRDKLKAAFENYGLPYERFTLFKPAVVDSILTQFGAALLGYEAKNGVDLFFMGAAAEKKKPVLELESFAEQVDMMNRIPEEAQIKMLAADLDGRGNLKEDLAGIIDVWKKGDLDACYKLEQKNLLAEPGLEDVFKLLVTDRNLTMARRLKALIDRGGTYFVVIGAGHFAGPGNVVDLLRREGFTVTRQ